MHEKADSANNGGREMAFDSLDREHDGELNNVGLVKISRIFSKQDTFFFGTWLFYQIYHCSTYLVITVVGLDIADTIVNTQVSIDISCVLTII